MQTVQVRTPLFLEDKTYLNLSNSGDSLTFLQSNREFFTNLLMLLWT